MNKLIQNGIFNLLLSLAIAPGLALGSVPNYINQRFSFQGLLRTNSGTAVSDGSYGMQFRIKTSSGGVPIWQKSIPNVMVQNGIFSVLIQGNDDNGLPMDENVFNLPISSGGLSMQMDVLVDYNGDSIYDDTFYGIPISPVPVSMLSNLANVASSVSDGAVSNSALQDGCVSTDKLADGGILASKIAQDGATPGQILTWNGSSWMAGTLGSVAPFVVGGGPSPSISISTATTSSTGVVQVGTGLSVNGSGVVDMVYGAAANTAVQGDDTRLSDSRAPTGSAGGDLTGSYPNPNLAVSGVTPGSYSKVTVDSKGRITAGGTLSAADFANLPVATHSQVGGLQATTGFITLNGSGAITSISATTATTASFTNSLRGEPVSSASPTAGKVLMFNGSQWEPATLPISSAVTTLNGLTSATQTFAVGSTGTNFGIVSSGTEHTFNLPSSSSSNRGLVNSSDWIAFNSKQAAVTSSTALNAGSYTSNSQLGQILNHELRFMELTSNGSAYVGFKAPDSITASRVWILPGDEGSSGQLLTTNGSGVLSWETAASIGAVTNVSASAPLSSSGGFTPTLSFTGTLGVSNGGTGATTALTAFNSLSPMTTAGDLIVGGASGIGARLAQSASGSRQFLTSSSVQSPIWGNVVAGDIPAPSGDLSGTYASLTVEKVQGVPVSTDSPETGDGLVYDGSSWTPVLVLASGTPAQGDFIGSYPAPVLSPLGIADGTYTKVDVDLKGRVTLGTSLSTADLPTLPIATNTLIGGMKATSSFLTLDGAGDITNLAATTAISAATAVSANGIQGIGVTSTPPSLNQILSFNGVNWAPDSSITTSTQAGVVLSSYGTSSEETGELRFQELAINGSKYIGFKAPDTIPASKTFVLPSTDGTAGYFLATNGSAVLNWDIMTRGGTVTQVSGGTGISVVNGNTFPVLSLSNSGVSSGTYPKVTVDATGRVTSGTTLSASDLPDLSGDWSGALSGDTVVSKIQGVSVSNTSPTVDQGLVYDGSNWKPVSILLPAAGGDLTGNYPNPTLEASGVSAGTYVKVTVDSKGRVTAGTTLALSDLPELPIATNSIVGVLKATSSFITLDGSGEITNIAATTAALASTATTANELQGVPVSVASPVSGQILTYNGSWASSPILVTSAVQSLNGLTSATQTFATATTGSDFTISSSGGVHSFQIPSSSTSNRGLLSSSDWTTFNTKQNTISASTALDTGSFTSNLQGGVVLNPYGSGTGTGETRFSSLSGSHYVGFRAPSSIASNSTWTLPAADGTSAQILSTNGSGALSWIGVGAAGAVTSVSADLPLISSGGGTPNISLGTVPLANGGTGATTASAAFANINPMSSTGDLFYQGASGAAILGGPTSTLKRLLSSTGTGSAAQAPTWAGVVAGDMPAPAGDVSGTYAALTVSKIRGVSVSASAPTTSQILAYSGSAWAPTTLSVLQPGTSAGGDLTGTYPNPSLASVVSSGTYPKVTVDVKGRVTAGTTLTLSDMPTGVARLGSANTWTTGAQELSSATSFKVPVSAGAAPSASGAIAYDSTANQWNVGVNSTTRYLTQAAGNLTSGNLLSGGGTGKLSDSGYSVQTAGGGAGNSHYNNGTSSQLARSDHTHQDYRTFHWYISGSQSGNVNPGERFHVPQGATNCAIVNSQISINGPSGCTWAYNIVRCPGAACGSTTNIYSSNRSVGSNVQTVVGGAPTNSTMVAGDAFMVRLINNSCPLFGSASDFSFEMTYKCESVN